MQRPRFSLRALLIAFMAICVLFGAAALWYRAQKAEFQQQMELGDKLQREGASLGWQPRMPKWLNWLGDSKKFRRIDVVNGWQPESISDDQWTWLSGLNGLGLALTADMLNDEMVARLSKLKPLKDLLILPPLPGGRSIDDRYYHFELQPEISAKLPGVNVVLGKAWHRTPLRGDSK